MKRAVILGRRPVTALSVMSLLWSTIGYAQSSDPPPGAARDEEPRPPPAAASQPSSPSARDLQLSPPSTPNVRNQEASEPSLDDTAGPGPMATPADDLGALPASSDERTLSLSETPGLSGATGLMRTQSATSGAVGTFRLSLMTGFYGGQGFLCPQCPSPDGEGSTLRDSVDRVTANFFVSATPLPYLEAYLGIYSHSTSTDRPVQQLKQVVGDWTLGAKGFYPVDEREAISVGGGLDLGFSTGSGQVGVSGIDSVNVSLRGLSTFDLSKLSRPLPVRAHANLGYFFDNSSNLVADFERQSGYIDRIERFSLDINRVDTMQFGLGVEGLFAGVRPFAEWSIDVPYNRQGFECDRSRRHSGDSCLRDRAVFSATPSRLSLGTRVMPWEAVDFWPTGIAVAAVADVATGGANDFLVEVAPEVPWSLWLGLSYAADTHPRIEVREIAAAAPPPAAPEPLRVHGLVVEKETDKAIADALIRFEGRDMTGLITTSRGQFVTSALEPGLYTLRINAKGYHEGTCTVEVLEDNGPFEDLPTTPTGAAAPASARGLASPNAMEEEPGLRCELEPVPKVSTVNGRVTDATHGGTVAGAFVTITDVLGRSLELQADEVGAFRFENVPPGTTSIAVRAEGYLPSVTKLDVEPLKDIENAFLLTPVPDSPSVRVQNGSLQMRQNIVFTRNSTQLGPDALSLVQELAWVLSENPELGPFEVQGHTSPDTPSADQVSTARANAVRDALILHGVPSGKLSAKGYGESQPPKGSAEADRVTLEPQPEQAEALTPQPATTPKPTPLPF